MPGYEGGPRDGSAGVSGVFGAGGQKPGSGLFRALGAVWAVWGRGERCREAVPFLRGGWQVAQEQAGDGEDTGGGQRWDEDPGPGAGERREQGGTSGGPVRGNAGSGAPALRAACGRLLDRGAGELRRGGLGGTDRGAEARGWDGEAAVAARDAGRQAVQGAWGRGPTGAEGGRARRPHRAGRGRRTREAQPAGEGDPGGFGRGAGRERARGALARCIARGGAAVGV